MFAHERTLIFRKLKVAKLSDRQQNDHVDRKIRDI